LELLASLSVQAALVVLTTAALTWFARDARVCCRLWSAGHLVLLGLVLAAVLMPHPRWWPRSDSELSRQAAAELLTLQMAWGRALFGAWLAGAVGLCGWMAVQSWRVSRFLRSCRLIPADHPALSDCREVLMAAGSQVTLLSSPSLAGPFCWQFHRPCIVLPEVLLGLSPRELGFIVRHEVAHLRTGHPLQVFWQRVVEVLFWFHPLVWWGARQVSQAREFACDDAAIDRPSQVADYLRTLLIVVEHTATESGRGSPALAFGRGQGLITARAHRLARIARFGWNLPASRTAFASAAVLWGVTLVGCPALWLPVNVTASPRSTWSPWPRWSASVLHELGIAARDFEVYGDRIDLHELLEHSRAAAGGARPAATTKDANEPGKFRPH
jgi:hypothetical protein